MAKLKRYDLYEGDDDLISNPLPGKQPLGRDAGLKARDEYNRTHGIPSGWKNYRLDLLRRVSEEDIIGPAKAANPDCRITIKYPNWAESYQETGYNPAE